MSLETIAINGTPIEAMRVFIEGGQPSVTTSTRNYDYRALPGRVGGVLGGMSSIEPKVLRFELQTDDSVQTDADLRQVLDDLDELLDGLLEVTYVGPAARRIVGIRREFSATIAAPSFSNVRATIVVEIICGSAAFEDVEPLHLVLGTTRVAAKVGTLPHAGRFYITGPNSTPFTITYRDVAGVVRGQLAISPSLSTGERMIIDLASQQVARVDSGDNIIPASSWDTGSTWFVIEPAHANRQMNRWPTLEASVGTLFEYRRNWERGQ